MSRIGAAILGVVVLSGCAYYNTLYNSQELFAEAEALRRTGQDSLAEQRYQDVIRKTSDAYRGRESGAEADRTLLLLGRAQLRVGQPREAHAALTEAAAIARDPTLRSEILVYLAFSAARLGEEAEALAHLDEALSDSLAGPGLGEAYLLRGRLRLQTEPGPAGWTDLQLAAEADPGVSLDAAVEELRWGVRYRDLNRVLAALGRMLLDRSAAERLDTISTLVDAAARRWSPSVAATMLGDVDTSVWDRTARNRLGLQRADLLHDAGNTPEAEEQAWRIARGRGVTAAEARLMLARWHLDRTRDLGEARSSVPILLPVADDDRAAELIDAVEDLERYSGIGLDDPLALFAAAEVARNRLGAPILARGLYLAYADTDPEDSWVPKALLAALSVALDEEDRSWLRGRLETHPNSPYVQAARGSAVGGIESLEEELQERLREISSR